MELTVNVAYDTSDAVQAMFDKAMLAYANWKRWRNDWERTDDEHDAALALRCADAYKTEYQATCECIALVVNETLYEVFQQVRHACKKEFGIGQG